MTAESFRTTFLIGLAISIDRLAQEEYFGEKELSLMCNACPSLTEQAFNNSNLKDIKALVNYISYRAKLYAVDQKQHRSDSTFTGMQIPTDFIAYLLGDAFDCFSFKGYPKRFGAHDVFVVNSK